MTTTTAERGEVRGKLTVRRPELDFSDTPKYWVLGDPQTTHSLNILNFGIPAGERFFIDSVKLALPYVTDEQLRADIRSFIGQEALHGRMHEKAADHLGLFDYPGIQERIDAMDRRREQLYARVDRLPEPFRKRAVLMWLSGTMLGEHFTALFADILFDRSKSDWDTVDPEMQQLLAWHAAEEMEHRTLPYDVYLHLGGDYITRVAPLVSSFALLPFGLIATTDQMMRLDPDLDRGFSVLDHIRAVRARRAPRMLDVIAKLPMYLLPNYHPSKLGDDDAAREYLASNPPSLAGTKNGTEAKRLSKTTSSTKTAPSKTRSKAASKSGASKTRAAKQAGASKKTGSARKRPVAKKRAAGDPSDN